MVQFANAAPPAPTPGTPYAINHLMPAAEGSLSDQPPYIYDPVPLSNERAISAEVAFTQQGPITGITTCYVVMQTDWGDGNWVDAAWCNLTALPGANPAVFTLFIGLDATNGAFQQTRAQGTAPTPANSGNTIALGARIRFVGKATVQSSSSSSSSSSGAPGVQAGILVTIRHRVLPAR